MLSSLPSINHRTAYRFRLCLEGTQPKSVSGLALIPHIQAASFSCLAPIPEVPDPGGAILSTCVHPAAILMEAHRCDVLIDPVIADDWVRVIGVEIIHADVLVTCGYRPNLGFVVPRATLPEIRVRLRVQVPAAAIMLRSGVISSAFTC